MEGVACVFFFFYAAPHPPPPTHTQLLPKPATKVHRFMTRPPLLVAHPGDALASVASRALERVTGVPVVDAASGACVGVLSRKDVARVADPATATVADAMTSPAVVVPPSATAAVAAAAALKHKVHRLPVVDAEGRLVGIVSRTDLFHALE